MNEENLYTYRAKVVKTKDVYDGDTLTAIARLGFDVRMKIRIRLAGINAPEVRGEQKPEGIISRDWLREKLVGEKIFIKTFKDKKGKYGRWLADIYYEGKKINDEMVEFELAEYKQY